MRYRIILGIAACIVALDQASKFVAERTIAPYEVIPVTGFFNLVNVRNYGAAFGFLNDPNLNWQFWFFLAATLLATGIIVYIAKKAEDRDKTLFFALGCILGGAIGNLVDRIRYRAVVDFLDFHYAGWHWPAFNVADIAICIGAGLAALLIWRSPLPAPSDNSAK
jgi:signal peptidase II